MGKRDFKKKNKGSAGNNRKIGEEFLKSNATKTGVLETESGLQYSVVEASNGIKAEANSTIEIHQRILLLNGTILIDTYKNNETEKVEMTELIEGLQEGIQLMSKGDRYKFWIPSDIAWGKKGTGNKIPPYAVLVCDIRLIDFY